MRATCLAIHDEATYGYVVISRYEPDSHEEMICDARIRNSKGRTGM
jgi:hypothetical protein